MSDGIYSALSGAIAQERALTAVANNVANATTTGYKGDKTIFAEVLNKTQSKMPIAPSLSYSAVNQLAIDNQSGALKQTGRTLDAALQGDAYFTVQTPQGERYTRAGSFVMDHQGVLRTLAGNEVLQENGPLVKPGRKIEIPTTAKQISINPDGEITADGSLLGKLKLVHFDDPMQLEREGLTLFKSVAGAVPRAVDPAVSVEQGFLEAANVNAVTGMNELINVNRSFDALQKVIDTFRQLDDRTVRDVGGKV
jgi:flagellar basal-body rod protein FlgF